MAITDKPTALQTDNEKATSAFESFLTPLEDTVEEVDINEVEVIEEDELPEDAELDEADEEYKRLNEVVGKQLQEGKDNTEEMQLLRSIKQKKEFIKANPFYGDNIPKKKIPKTYNVPNLWRAELINYWRMLYTIRGDRIEIICFILDILNHKKYDKKFGYRKQ